jgi:hypothetical protein
MSITRHHRLASDQAAMISIVTLVVISIVSLAVTTLFVTTSSLLRRQTVYSEAGRAAYCSEAVTNTVIAQSNLSTIFGTCEAGQCIVFGGSTCAPCGSSGTTMTCAGPGYSPTVTCTGLARLGYKTGTGDKNLSAIAECGKASYSFVWDYTDPGPAPVCGGGGIVAPGVPCGSAGSSGLH